MSDLHDNTYTPTFFVCPSYILDLPGITLGYLRVYEAIFQFWNKNKSCFLSEAALCERSGLKRTQVYAALSYFESIHEIKRVQKGLKRYIVRPEKLIETDCSNIKQVSGRADASTKISQPSGGADEPVRWSGRDPSGGADYNTKKLNKENNKTSTTAQAKSELVKKESSSSFFITLKIDQEALALKLDDDSRSNEEFLRECKHHIDTNSDPSMHLNQRRRGMLTILNKCFEDGLLFTSKGYSASSSPTNIKKPGKNETQAEKEARIIEENRQEKINRGYYDGPNRIEKLAMEFLGIAS